MCEEGLHDPFTDQVECARYRAERDMLVQAMERVADDIERTFLGFEGAEDAPAMRWAREFRAALGSLHAPVRDTTMSAYDLLPEAERDAIAWVREHGGLDAVKKLLDWVVGHCSTRQQLDFDFWLSGRVMHELGFEEDMADRDEVERRLLARLMPDGYEWPKVDGKPVVIGERLVGYGSNDDGYEVVGVRPTCGWVLVKSRGHIHRDGGPVILEWDASKCHRLAPKVLDADGAEIREGDTVCLLPGDWCDKFPLLRCHEWDAMKVLNLRPNHATSRIECVTSPSSVVCYPYPSQLTHRAPVLAADGRPLRVGETVWHIKTGREYVVVEPSYGDTVVVRLAKYDDAEGEQYAPDHLTHEHPVLGADGVPIKVGDTVWYVPTPNEAKECKVEELPEREKGERAVCLLALDGTIISCPTRYVTHERPVADS